MPFYYFVLPDALSHKYAAVQAKEIIEMMLIATADEILCKCLKMGGFDVPKRNGTNLKLIVKFKWRRRKRRKKTTRTARNRQYSKWILYIIALLAVWI
jgi:hypothetical protein